MRTSRARAPAAWAAALLSAVVVVGCGSSAHTTGSPGGGGVLSSDAPTAGATPSSAGNAPPSFAASSPPAHLLPSSGGSFSTGTSTVPAGTQVSASCGSGRATLAVGARLRLVSCPPGTRAAVVGHAVVTAGPFVLRAVRTGTAIVQLSGGPVCSPGQVCPQFRTNEGRIVITVR